MKYISIDIETTGLNPEACQILQIGAVIEDTLNPAPLDSLPRFNCLVEHEVYSGQPTALSMNSWILKTLSGLENLAKDERLEYRKTHNIMPVGIVAKSFAMWLMSNGILPEEANGPVKINAAGKNFASFDKQFLQRLPNWGAAVQIRQRILDPAILFMDWQQDSSLPNLNTCITRAKLDGIVTHDAVQDALDVIRVIRAATNNYQTSDAKD